MRALWGAARSRGRAPALGLVLLALAYGGGWALRERFVEPAATALACNVAAPPPWCAIRFALLFGQHNLLFGTAALAAGAVALFRGGRGLALAAAALSLLALANYNVGTGALALVLALIAWVGAAPRPAAGQDAG